MPIERATYPGFFGGVLTSTNIDNNPFEKTNFLPGHSKVEVDFKNIELFGDKIDPLCMGVSCSGHGICYQGDCACLHGWSGPSCSIDPCHESISMVPSEKQCGECKVTLKLNPATIVSRAVSSVMVAGSFSAWTTFEMTEEPRSASDSSDTTYDKLYGRQSLYHGYSSSRVFEKDLYLPNNSNHTYKFLFDQNTWAFDMCNSAASDDGMEIKGLNSELFVSCNSTCDLKPAEGDLPDELQPVDNYQSGAVIQMFEWTFKSVAKECARLGREGWSAVMMSPVNSHLSLTPDLVDSFNVGGSQPPIYPWWQRYQSGSFDIKSRSGTEADLRIAAEECARHGE